MFLKEAGCSSHQYSACRTKHMGEARFWMQTAKTVFLFNVSTGPDLDASPMSYKIPQYCRDEEHPYHYSFVMRSFPILPLFYVKIYFLVTMSLSHSPLWIAQTTRTMVLSSEFYLQRKYDLVHKFLDPYSRLFQRREKPQWSQRTTFVQQNKVSSAEQPSHREGHLRPAGMHYRLCAVSSRFSVSVSCHPHLLWLIYVPVRKLSPYACKKPR